MHEYIKRSDAIAEINRGDLLVGNCAEWAREIIWRTPYADVIEVKRGHWIMGSDGSYMCSECGRVFRYEIGYYCSFCGAKLEYEE